MDSALGTGALPPVGFPIRKSPDQRSFSSSPRLIAAIHVLHRLLVPRHPPCALVLLNRSPFISREHQLPLCSFQGTRAPTAHTRRDANRPVGPWAGLARRTTSSHAVRRRRSLKAQQHGHLSSWETGGGRSGSFAVPISQSSVDIDSRRAPCCGAEGAPESACSVARTELGTAGTACGGASATASLERR
jgi:hypothetical protein